MEKIGRNDPCHCGSGRKYKKCHLDADQRQQAQSRPSHLESEAPPATVDVKNLPKLIRQLAKGASGKEFSELLAKSGPLLDYMDRKEEIEAAGVELETHRAAYEELARDTDRHLALARSLFSEECFAPLRFTASEVQRAFDAVGQPDLVAPDERTVSMLLAAILHVADKDRRSLLAMGLMAQLPEFVRAGRYMEAWIVRCAAFETAQHPDSSNVFLFQMFSYGHDAWTAGKRAADEALLRKAGVNLDHLRGMSPDELDAWIQSQVSDPAKAAGIEELFRNHPLLREESEAKLKSCERHSATVLDRHDSHFLLIPNDEVQPWIARFNDRLQDSILASTSPETPLPDETIQEVFEQAVWPLMSEMAASIFTRDRLLQLVAKLKQYRNDRFAAGDYATVQLITGAIRYLEREDSPGENGFLLTLCLRSLRAATEADMVRNLQQGS